MKETRFMVDDLTGIMRRRKLAFLLPVVLITTACLVGAYMLPKEYESSTTILVQGNAVPNPLDTYAMEMGMASDDRLEDFNEIIYSTPALNALADSLGVELQALNQQQRDLIVAGISKRIKTERRGTNIFAISYIDRNPRRAQKAVGVIANILINARLAEGNRKNEFAVQFYSEKLDQLRGKFENTQEQLVDVMRNHIGELPEGDRELYNNIKDYDSGVDSLSENLKTDRQAVDILQSATASGNNKIDVRTLYQLPTLNVPGAAQFQTAIGEYDELSQQYTPQYPKVQAAHDRLVSLIGIMKNQIESDVSRMQTKIWKQEQDRNKTIVSLQEATAAQSQDKTLQSNFDLYKGLYNDMKIKLEEAQEEQDINNEGGQEYVIIDPPNLPVVPAKPRKLVIILGGFSLGLFIGFLAALLSELFDSRISTPADIDLYDKPIIAYLPSPGFDVN